MAASEAEFKRMLVEALPRLRRYAHALARDADAGEDLAQSAAAHALRQQALFTPGLRFDVWLIRLTRNLWIDQIRRRKARPEFADNEAVLRAPQPNTSVEMERRLMVARAMTAFRALPENLRETAALVLLEGFTYQETADVQGVPIGTVMSRVSRARAAIARFVLGEDAGAGEGLERHDH
jgi:RNA polymerase sigma-70 factor, ECF subfamily